MAITHTPQTQTPLAPSDCRARVDLELPITMQTGQWFAIPCTVTNLSSKDYLSQGPHPIHLASRWNMTSPDNSAWCLDGLRTRFLEKLAPGASTDCILELVAPHKPGRYKLVVTLVQETVAWFDDLDPSQGVTVDVEVVEALHSTRAQEAQEQVNTVPWAHSIELGEGVRSRGKFGPPDQTLMRAFDGIDFEGKTVLDVGCWDGLWTFEAERRGAREVWSIDRVGHRPRGEDGYRLAHRLLGSKAHYQPQLSVYDIETLGKQDFDIVLFSGVYYHLKHPLLALTKLRHVLCDGGIIVVEGVVIDEPSMSYARYFYKNRLANNDSNWWVPTTACLREWVESSYLDIRNEYPSSAPYLSGHPDDQLTRHAITARAVRRTDSNYGVPDEEFLAFDLRSNSLVP